MDNGAELDKSLIPDPAVGVLEAVSEEIDAFLEPIDLIFLDVLDQMGHVLDTDLSNSPHFVLLELVEGRVYFLDENIVIQVLRHRQHCREEEFLDLEQLRVQDILEVRLQEVRALLLLEHAFVCELLDDDEDGYLRLLLDVFCLLVLARGRDSVHYDLDDLQHQILGLLLWNVLLRQVQEGFDPFSLDWLLAEHQHPGGQWEYVDRDDVDDLGLWDEDFGLEELLEKLLKILEELQLQVVLLTRVDLHAGEDILHGLVESHDFEDVLEVQHELSSLVEDLVVVVRSPVDRRVEDI